MVDEEIIAKSDPRQDLKTHTETVLKNLYDFKKLNLLKLDQKDWEILEKACLYHDFGKANDRFQTKIRRQKIKVNIPDFPHNYLSLAFIQEEDELLNKLVAFSHWREFESISDDDYRKLIENLKKYIPSLKKYFRIKFSVVPPLKFAKKIEKIKNYYNKRKDALIDINKERKFITLLGLLNRFDHSASAGVTVEKKPVPKDIIIKNFLLNITKSPWQLKIYEKIKNQNGVIVASTGIGKTEMGLLWAGDRKTFYTLPVKTSVDAMYQRLKKVFGRGNVGLLHSEAIGRLLMEHMTEHMEIHPAESFLTYDTSKNLATPVTVSTVDQLFSATLKYLGFEKIYATLSYSNVIIDEIQAYSPHTLAIIIHGLKEIKQMGARYLILTATFPTFIKNYIEYEFFYKKVPNLVRHNIKIIDEPLAENIIDFIEREKTERILIVCNTVKKAQKIFNYVKSKTNTLLLHSRFMRFDRMKKENKLLRGFRGVLVTTQVVEVSLDIDFDVIFTELAPIEVLIQRMGRVFRRYKNDGEYAPSQPNVYIFTEEVSGRGNVYESDILQKTLNFIKNGKLYEDEKLRIVDSFYREENLRHTQYFNKFKNVINLIKKYNTVSKRQAQEIFREMDIIEIIPEEFLFKPIKNKKLCETIGVKGDTTLLKVLQNVKITNKKEKILIYELLKDFFIPVNYHLIKKKEILSLLEFLESPHSFFREIKVARGVKYDEDKGLLLNEERKDTKNII